jgi:Predicted ATPase
VLNVSAEAVTPSNVISMAKHCASIGIITHPLHGRNDNCKSPGKQPITTGWQKLDKPFDDGEIDAKFSNNGNLGYICGLKSDLNVIDVDHYIKGIWDYILAGEDTSQWVKQSHTDNKWHWLFRYFPDIKAKTYQPLGFDILGNTEAGDGGNNCVAAPSIHPDGNMYQLIGNIEERPEIPKVVLTRIKKVIDIYAELTKILLDCREPFLKLFNAVFVDKKHELYGQTSIFRGSEGRIRHLHLCAELKANGADEDHLMLVSALIFGDGYDKVLTRRELGHINERRPAKTESITADPYLSQFYVERKKVKAKQETEKMDKITFDMIGDRVLEKHHIFTLRDAGQMYIYENGVYNSQIAKTRLNTIIRQEFKDCYLEIWQELNPDDEPDKIPAASKNFVEETLAYIQAYTYKIRDDIDRLQGKYINLKNGLFNLETWELEPHNPEYLSIQQIPITFDKNGTCPKIEQFLNQVLTPQDVTLTLEWIGYLLTPDTSHQKALIFYGAGGNGKSVLLDLIINYIGDGNCSNESLHDLEKEKLRL